MHKWDYIYDFIPNIFQKMVFIFADIALDAIFFLCLLRIECGIEKVLRRV